MTNIDQEALEELLRHASPRTTPSQQDEAAVREAVRAEWRELTGKRRNRQRIMQYAIAATVLLAAFLTFSAFRPTIAPVVQVATIEKSIGPVYLLGEQAVLRETTDLSNVSSGQTIVTGDGAGLALAWGNGGMLRIDEGSRVAFTDDKSIYLEKGRIYFDSQPVTLTARTGPTDPPELVVRTEFGEVRHVGTQYISDVDSGELVVSVREGKVSIDGTFHDQIVLSGQQATLAGSQQPSVLGISRSGEVWGWVNRITPPFDVEGRSAHEFLTWACREMGLDLEFEGQAESRARDGVLKGVIDKEPAIAVSLRLATHALESRVEGGTLYIYESR